MNFCIVNSDQVGHAHTWHTDFAAANDAIYPRTQEAFSALALDRNVWCAVTDEEVVLGLSYACVSDDESEVEIGGLMVSPEARGKGIGDVLMRLPLCHFLVNENPLAWRRPPRIVAHVLKGNDAPRRIIARTGFAHAKAVRIPGAALPGLRTEPDGHVHGDEFHLRIPQALEEQAVWLDGWNDTLLDGSAARIRLLEGHTLPGWAAAIRAMA
ncbi:GNAT family N-acetyltransferase [Antarcticirhabdus aurantiaca]|uniref:GNAT family N-acetyltransferase n=1 Tax=Antarcticirhabdus aurantiaca TaxID=2606717 RepID=A0ACD4NS09_9HYPH|nr:GNAT family N-acetyltransferase [Antarcticirhabdus aurantiaca]WAJ29426.1 GNAT family N-acetyltransferase [Jeongeuplla avenae]